ncbi:hypothetical protein MMC28_002586 [Mycoblastus sanguinarius]|nr:hypothetical protein [Mycoblastus sanguinarius]
MPSVHTLFSSLLHLIFAIASTTATPAQLLQDADTLSSQLLNSSALLLQLPNSTLSPNPRTSNLTAAANAIPFPIPWTPIALSITIVGRSIPPASARIAIDGAIARITPFVAHASGEPITHNRFHYRAPGSNVQLTITAYEKQKITWLELQQILSGLWMFMSGQDTGSGWGPNQFKVLEFEIDVWTGGSRKRVGGGLFWYYPTLEVGNGTSVARRGSEDVVGEEGLVGVVSE